MSILTKCLPVMRVVRSLQTVMQDSQGLSIIIERSIIDGGLILLMGFIDMIDSVVGRGTKTSQSYYLSTQLDTYWYIYVNHG